MKQTLLRKLLEQSGVGDLAMCLYAVTPFDDPDPRPLFFYHMEKGGGIAVHSCIRTAFAMAQALTGQPHSYLRFHADDDLTAEQLAEFYAKPLNACAFVGKVGLQTFGMHENFNRRWRLMTILRDPFDRLVSHYFYLLRRQLRAGPASESDFVDYAKDWRNHCYHLRMLCRDTDADRSLESIRDEAMENLASFDFVGTLDQIEDMLLNVWSVYRFLPVLTQQIHANPHKTSQFEHLRDDIYELNRMDKELVDKFSASPRAPVIAQPETDNNLSVPSHLGVIVDHQGEANFSGSSKAIEAGQFFQRLDQRPASLNAFLE